MMLSTLVWTLASLRTLLSLGAPAFPVSASDYFPLIPGFKATYDDSALHKAQVLNVVQPSLKIGDRDVCPISTYLDGQKTDTVYYSATENEIVIVAYDLKHPLANPRPVFRVGPGKVTWTYQGVTPFFKDPVSLLLTGESRPGGKKKILRETVETLLVSLDATIGDPKTGGFLVHQEMVFAKGIGMTDMVESAVVAGKKQSHHVRLIAFEPGGAKG